MKLESRRRTQSSRITRTSEDIADIQNSRPGSELNLTLLTSDDHVYDPRSTRTSPRARRRNSETDKSMSSYCPGMQEHKRQKRNTSSLDIPTVSDSDSLASQMAISRDDPSQENLGHNEDFRSIIKNKDRTQASNSMASSMGDSLSVKSEGSLTPTVRSSGRRTRPSARLSAGMVAHKDSSEVDSLSLLSDLDTHSNISTADAAAAIASLHGRRRSTDKRSNSSDDGAATSSSTGRTPSETIEANAQPNPPTIRYSPISEDPAEVLTVSARPSLDIGTDLDVDRLDGSEDSRSNTRRSASPTVPTTSFSDEEDTTIMNGGPEEMARTLQRRTSSSSLSSELSEVSSISSLGSQATVSSTGSNTIRHLTQTTEAGNEIDRQRACLQALTLVKKWRQTWLVLDKKVKANAKKQERNRIAREQAALQSVNGKRRR